MRHTIPRNVTTKIFGGYNHFLCSGQAGFYTFCHLPRKSTVSSDAVPDSATPSSEETRVWLECSGVLSRSDLWGLQSLSLQRSSWVLHFLPSSTQVNCQQ